MTEEHERHIEILLRAIRTVSYEDAREHLKEFAVSCRAQGMIDFVKALEASSPLNKNLAELKAKVEGSTVEKGLKDG